MILGNYNALWLLFAVPMIIVPVYLWCFLRKRRALNVFAERKLMESISASASFKRQVFKAVLLTAAFVSIVAALTEPKWNKRTREVKHKGRDVAVVLDVSRSMLAEDISPSRLERAKIAIGDLIEAMAGDRIAIVTFAGNSTVKCPLTQDYAFARMVVDDITTESTSRGGTMIGDALRKTADEVLGDTQGRYRDIVLITDGSDQESFPVEAAQKCSEKEIRILAIGLGSSDEGARIPMVGNGGEKTFLKYNGREVWVKLEGELLRQIAAASEGGMYLAVEPGTTFNLDQIYDQLIASAQKRELETAAVTEYDEQFQIFIGLALILIFCEAIVSERRKV
ncbi:MAG: VWA domain-containing protein [Anaerohalosphaeraceae bacterium]|nr:VWA domain-containing protein [Anaerohalosphaeraceae bacterium]